MFMGIGMLLSVSVSDPVLDLLPLLFIGTVCLGLRVNPFV